MIRELQEQLIAQLKAQRVSDGLWEGHLSSSAVSTALASFALSLRGETVQSIAGIHWLLDNVNSDGGWGDTPESPSNMTATLITSAALHAVGSCQQSNLVRAGAHTWLCEHLGHDDFITGIVQYYGKDLTFSAPLLTMCALAGMLGDDAWSRIPQLPFRLAILPRFFFTLVNISVVSYALPALIAVGLLQYRKAGKLPLLTEKLVIPRILRKLEAMLPSSGGFLEAAPLTAFVGMCLHGAGYEDLKVTQGTMGFLAKNQREDGSWPIDTNLSTWLSSLSLKALAENGALTLSEKEQARQEMLSRQCLHVHPFTEAAPGGWAWTNLPGGVPDADDSAAALVALSLLDTPYSDAIEQGLSWLLRLMNRDGGMPTFCKGWGFLPFDRSCPDITAHALRAFALWRKHKPRLGRQIAKMRRYLQKTQDADGAWSPLWFGAQDVADKRNRVYGTAVVLEHLHVLPESASDPMVQRGLTYLLKVRNADGLWGGDLESKSNIECSAKAIAALAAYAQTRDVAREAAEILAAQETLPTAPIGLYFASLWYDEELYPLIFTLSSLCSLRHESPHP